MLHTGPWRHTDINGTTGRCVRVRTDVLVVKNTFHLTLFMVIGTIRLQRSGRVIVSQSKVCRLRPALLWAHTKQNRAGEEEVSALHLRPDSLPFSSPPTPVLFPRRHRRCLPAVPHSIKPERTRSLQPPRENSNNCAHLKVWALWPKMRSNDV